MRKNLKLYTVTVSANVTSLLWNVSLFSGGGGGHNFCGEGHNFFLSCLGEGHNFFQDFLGEGHNFLKAFLLRK